MMVIVLIAANIATLILLAWLMSWTNFIWQNIRVHAESLDRANTELGILKEHLGVTVYWDQVDPKKENFVEYSYPARSGLQESEQAGSDGDD